MLVAIDELQEALCGMHKDVKGVSTASRKRHIDRQNHQTNVHGTGFVKGDFVLVRRRLCFRN